MSKNYFISDLHLGHRNVLKFEDFYRARAMGVETIEQHDEMICDNWNSVVTKRDTVYVLGDLGYNIEVIKGLPGTKKLLLGNHDTRPAREYLELFDDIIGPLKYKKHWLAHIPPVQSELYGAKVIAGHTHSKGVNDSRYINVCVEMTGGNLVSFQDIQTGIYQTWNRVNYPFGVVDNSVDNNPAADSASSID